MRDTSPINSNPVEEIIRHAPIMKKNEGPNILEVGEVIICFFAQMKEVNKQTEGKLIVTNY